MHGSEFLRLAPEHWPALEKLAPLDAGDPEVKKPVATSLTVQTPVKEHPVEKLVASYLNWSRLLRALACFTMAADVCRKKIPPTKELRAEHMQKAEEALVAHVQARHYGQEIGALAQKGKLDSSSPLVRLRPALKVPGGPWAPFECAPPRGSQGPSRLTLPAYSRGVPGTTHGREDSTLRARIHVGRVEATLLGGRGLVTRKKRPGWLPPV